MTATSTQLPPSYVPAALSLYTRPQTASTQPILENIVTEEQHNAGEQGVSDITEMRSRMPGTFPKEAPEEATEETQKPARRGYFRRVMAAIFDQDLTVEPREVATPTSSGGDNPAPPRELKPPPQPIPAPTRELTPPPVECILPPMRSGTGNITCVPNFFERTHEESRASRVTQAQRDALVLAATTPRQTFPMVPTYVNHVPNVFERAYEESQASQATQPEQWPPAMRLQTDPTDQYGQQHGVSDPNVSSSYEYDLTEHHSRPAGLNICEPAQLTQPNRADLHRYLRHDYAGAEPNRASLLHEAQHRLSLLKRTTQTTTPTALARPPLRSTSYQPNSTLTKDVPHSSEHNVVESNPQMSTDQQKQTPYREQQIPGNDTTAREKRAAGADPTDTEEHQLPARDRPAKRKRTTDTDSSSVLSLSKRSTRSRARRSSAQDEPQTSNLVNRPVCTRRPANQQNRQTSVIGTVDEDISNPEPQVVKEDAHSKARQIAMIKAQWAITEEEERLLMEQLTKLFSEGALV